MEDKIAIIDIGSNSVRMTVTQITSSGAYKLIDEIKEVVRLSENMGSELLIKDQQINKLVETINLFVSLGRAHRATNIIAVATAAIRRAKNRVEIIQRIEDEVGIKIRVLSGKEEAGYGYLGVCNSLQVSTGLMLDIGGGSSELVYFKENRIVESTSLPIGAVTAYHKYFADDRVEENSLMLLKKEICKQLDQLGWDKALINGLMGIGIGGTIRNLAKIDRKRNNYSLDRTHGYEIDYTTVLEVNKMMINTTLEQRKKISGLSKERADIFPSGLAILLAIMEYFKMSDLVVSGSGIREGLFYEYLHGPTVMEPRDILKLSVNNMLSIYNVRNKHSQHVAELAVAMAEQLQQFYQWGPREKRLLYYAGLLHDIGININYYDHHKHTYYLLTSYPLMGLNHKDICMLACLAAGHSKGSASKLINLHQDLLDNRERDTIEKLSMLLKLAESFDRSETGKIEHVRCQIDTDKVYMSIRGTGTFELEVKDAFLHAKSFSKVYNRDLEIN